MYLPSDENYKTNINELEEASTLLGQLNPVSYEYNNEMGIPFGEGLVYGLVSQQVEEVLPSLVRDVIVPVKRDSLGEVVREEMVIKSLRHNDFIALLIKGHQEQSVTMAAQTQENEALAAQVAVLSEQLQNQEGQIAAMQEQMTTVMASFQSTQSKMNNCCGTTPTEKDRSETGAIKLEQNFPNPFEDVTTINFSINETAQIRLEISDALGRVLEVLVSQRMEEGQYTERWDASAFAPGTYYYSLYADTELLTKKMIKK